MKVLIFIAPAYSIVGRPQPQQPSPNPGPGAYSHHVTVGEAPAYTMSGRPNMKENLNAPGNSSNIVFIVTECRTWSI